MLHIQPVRRASVVIALVLAAPAAAQAPGDPVRVDPAVAGKASHLILDVRNSEDPQANGRTPRAAVLAAAAGFKFDPRARAARCSESQAAAFECPAASRIGAGSADATVSSGPFSGDVTVDVTVFLAPPPRSGDVAGVVLHFRERSTGRQGTTTGRVVKVGGGPFGLEVRFEDLARASQVEGFQVRVNRLQADVGAFRNERVKRYRTVRRKGKKRRVAYYVKVRRDLIRNPRTCLGSWPYQLRLRYSDTHESVRDGAVRCSNSARR